MLLISQLLELVFLPKITLRSLFNLNAIKGSHVEFRDWIKQKDTKWKLAETIIFNK